MKKSSVPLWKIALFVSILCIAAFLRFYKLDQIPPGVNRDEASIGFTAYSLIQTGKDEYSRSFPLSFQSFGDWKLPLYVYIVVPFVKVFGVSELAVRLPSVLAGIATVALAYVLVQQLLKSQTVSFLSMLLLAISPWHLHLSRVESESNLAVLFTVIALLLFFRGIKKYPIALIGSAVFFALPYYTYHGNHMTTTLFLIGLLYLFRHSIPKIIHSIFAGGIFVLLVGFILFQTLHQADTTKLSGISIFGNPAVIHEKIEIPRNRYPDPNAWNVRLLHNRVTFAIEMITQNYVKAFGPEFLFIRGGTNHAHNIENFGNLYIVEAPFFYLGIILLFLQRKEKKTKLLLWWLLVAPVAASITKDAPHTNRMFAIYPLPPLIAALGIYTVIKTLWKKRRLRILGISGIIIAYAINVNVYLNRYFIQFPKKEAQYWGNTYKDLYKQLSAPKLLHKTIIVSHPEYSPYIFFLFYSKFDPKKYQQTAVRYPPTEDAFTHIKSYDRYTFREIQWDKDIHQTNTVLVDFTKDVPNSIRGNQVSIFTLVETP